MRCTNIRLGALLLLLSVVRAAYCGEPKTVAVWDFDNATIASSADSAPVESLQRVLPEALLAGLNRISAIRAVERVNLREVLREQKLGAGELTDDDSRLKLGKIAGAQYMVFATYMDLDGGLRLDLRAVEVETSAVGYVESVTGNHAELLGSMDTIARKLAQTIGAAPSEHGAATTADNAAWALYDQGIKLMDAGKYQEALVVFKEVLEAHTDFKPAEKQISLALERMARQ